MEEETWESASFSDDYEVSNRGRVRQKNSWLVLQDVKINEHLLDAFIEKPDTTRADTPGKFPVEVEFRGKAAPLRFDSVKDAAQYLAISESTIYSNIDLGFVNDISVKKMNGKRDTKAQKRKELAVHVIVRGEDPEKFDSVKEAAAHLGLPATSLYRNTDKGFVNGISIVTLGEQDKTEGTQGQKRSLPVEVTVRGKAPMKFDSPKEAAKHLGKSVATIYKNIDQGFVDRISIVKERTKTEGLGLPEGIKKGIRKTRKLKLNPVEVTVRGKNPLVFKSKDEAAKHLGKSTKTIRRNINKGFVNGVSVVYVKHKAIKEESSQAFVGLVSKRRKVLREFM